MGAIENEKVYGLTVRESANDGSDFTNPDADYRRLFLGEDGQLHVKDSAGTVTDIGTSTTADHNHTAAGGDGGDLDSPVIDGYAVFNEESAPGSADAATVRLYAKSDGLLYSKDDAGTETLVSGGAGGGSVGWNQVVNESGTSFANFTAASGTWSSNGTEITQTDTAATWRRAKQNTLVPIGFPSILEVEAQIVTTSGDRRAAIGITDGTNGNGLAVELQTGVGVQIDRDSGIEIRTITATITHATWYKVRVVLGNNWMSVYLDGTLIGNVPLMTVGLWDSNAEFVSLLSYQSSVLFRSLKAWTLSTGAPA